VLLDIQKQDLALEQIRPVPASQKTTCSPSERSKSTNGGMGTFGFKRTSDRYSSIISVFGKIFLTRTQSHRWDDRFVFEENRLASHSIFG
jgi:hypothetical protein